MERPTIRLGTINMDCRDSEATAAFYERLLGWEVKWRDGTFIILGNPDGGPDISFEPYADYRPPVWPEQPGAPWKMIHLDMMVEDLDAAAAWAIECGGRLAEFQGRDDLRVILDPSGHPLCLGRE
jgi:catechol 2,3-dioxygenase-like lactoylglutathione lyase family enzyme